MEDEEFAAGVVRLVGAWTQLLNPAWQPQAMKYFFGRQELRQVPCVSQCEAHACQVDGDM